MFILHFFFWTECVLHISLSLFLTIVNFFFKKAKTKDIEIDKLEDKRILKNKIKLF